MNILKRIKEIGLEIYMWEKGGNRGQGHREEECSEIPN